ncbi:hypothetical protein SD81_035180 [Tolypothrix campylonemoides VB511288]|nr:hypothetical protein SD81_035180 [Tolypothrix campylonemoides VB511288]
MSKLFWDALKQIPMLLGVTLIPANYALAKPQTSTKPSAQQLSSVADLLDVQSPAVNTADNLTLKASVFQINAQFISQEATKKTTTVPVAQTAEPEPNNAPSNSDYIGIGGSIGLSGDKTALGSGGLAILSKNRLTDNLSLHSTNVVFGSRTAISTFALTFGIPIRDQLSGQVLAFPFVGGGLLVKGDFDVNGLATGGVDVPISQDLTATAQVNVGFLDDDTDVGLQIGIGYNFRLF